MRRRSRRAHGGASLALPGSAGARASAARRTLLTVESTQGPATLLADHQLHVAATQAHTDATLQRLGEVLHDYQLPPGDRCSWPTWPMAASAT
jgi:hypothetical protein